jgi:hypothetical protein
MMPGGHLATALALSGAAYAATGSVEAAAGCFAGGFLIDVDHYLDYLVFEKQWRRPSPVHFLKYYLSGSPRRLVLPLHSLELMSVLFVFNLIHPNPLLVGYWFGAAMHLVFDVMVNGDYGLRRPVLFYVFTYRATHRFAANCLVYENSIPEGTVIKPVRDFFVKWLPTCPPPSRRREAAIIVEPRPLSESTVQD